MPIGVGVSETLSARHLSVEHSKDLEEEGRVGHDVIGDAEVGVDREVHVSYGL